MDKYIVNEDGKIFYKVIGEGRPILFIHGGPGLTHNYFLPHFLDLAKLNYKLIFFDQRGNGKSTYLNNSKYINIDQFTNDIEILRKELNIDKLIIFGHSMGTFFAMDYAKKFPQNVENLILCNATPMNLNALGKMNEIMIKRLNPYTKDLDNITNTVNFKNYDKDTLKKYLVELNRHNFFDETLVYKLFEGVDVNESYIKNFEFINTTLLNEYVNLLSDYDISSIESPILIINSDYDFIPIESSLYIKNKVNQCEIKTIYKSGHYPFIEKTEEVINTIDSYLKKFEV